MAYSISNKVPATFVIIKIGAGEKEGDENSITIVNRLDGKNENLSNVHLVGLNVDQLSFDIIKYTIELQYHPNTFELGNPNKLEQAISNILVNTSASEDKSRDISIQFGYSSGSPYPRNIRTTSDIYIGSILEMKTNLNQNYISYTITAFGKYIEGSNSRLDDSVSLSIEDPITDWIKGLWGVSSIKGKYYLPDLFRKHFKFSSDVSLPSLLELSGWNNLYTKIDNKVTKVSNSNSIMFTNNDSNNFNPLTASNSVITKVHDDATIKILDDCLLEFSTNDVSKNVEQKSLQFSANFDLITLLQGIINRVNLLCSSDTIKQNPNAAKFYGHQFAITLDSFLGSNEQYGFIRLVDTTETKNRPKFNYTFNYGSIESGDTFNEHLVLSWDCDFNATAAIHTAELTEEIGITRHIETTGNMSVDYATGLAKVQETGKSSLSSEDSKQTSADNIAKLKQTWNYPYNATLTVLGNPEPIKVCQHLIYVNPIINNRKHHTAGYYLVVGVSHSFDASMHYTTTYKLTRLDDSMAESFAEANTDAELENLYKDVMQTSEQTRNVIYGYKNIDIS